MSTLCRFDTTYRVVTMSVKLHRVVQEILVIKKEYFERLKLVKVEIYQDNIKA